MEIEALTAADVPVAVICGADDTDNGSASVLAEKLTNAQYIEIPGTHMSSVTEGALGDAMVNFLSEGI